MTVIRPNSVSGITSITAQANEINFFRSNGTLAGLQLNGVNFNTTAGISTLAALKVTGNLDVEGVLTYQDVTNVDSVGIITARSGVVVTGVTTTTQLKVTTGANAFETSSNVFKGASGQKGVYLRSALSSATTPSYSSVDDTNTGIFLPGSDVFAVTTGGTERLRITGDGDVAIGRTTALNNYAAGSTTTQLAVIKNGGAAGSGYHEVAHFTGGNDSNDTGAIVRITQFNNDRGFYIKGGRGTSDQAKAIFGLRNSANSDSDDISMLQGGILVFNNTINSIHTNSDNSKLVLFGGSTNSVSFGGVLSLHGITNSSGNYTDLSAATGGHIQFRSGTSEKFRITAGGEVLCGVTTTGTDATKNITLHAGSMMRVSNFYMGRVHGSANNGNGAIVLHKLGQNQGFQMSGSMTFHSYTGSAYLSGCIVARYNNDAVSRDVSLQKANSGMNLQLVTGTISGVSGNYLAIKKNGGGTGVCYINGFFGCNIESYGGIREIPSGDWTTTTVHGSGITGSNDSASS